MNAKSIIPIIPAIILSYFIYLLLSTPDLFQDAPYWLALLILGLPSLIYLLYFISQWFYKSILPTLIQPKEPGVIYTKARIIDPDDEILEQQKQFDLDELKRFFLVLRVISFPTLKFFSVTMIVLFILSLLLGFGYSIFICIIYASGITISNVTLFLFSLYNPDLKISPLLSYAIQIILTILLIFILLKTFY